MKGGKRSKMAVAASVIVVAAMVLAVAHFYVSADSQAISVQDSHLSVTYSADFKNISSLNPYDFYANVPRAVVSDANHTSSSLYLGLTSGTIFYNPNGGYPEIDVNFFGVISGHFTTNLQPKSLTLSYDGQNSLEFIAWSTRNVSNISISETDLWALYHYGPGWSNTTVQLMNESTNLQAYNFSMLIGMNLIITGYPSGTHTFDFSAQVNGLSKPVVAGISMSIVELVS